MEACIKNFFIALYGILYFLFQDFMSCMIFSIIFSFPNEKESLPSSESSKFYNIVRPEFKKINN